MPVISFSPGANGDGDGSRGTVAAGSGLNEVAQRISPMKWRGCAGSHTIKRNGGS